MANRKISRELSEPGLNKTLKWIRKNWSQALSLSSIVAFIIFYITTGTNKAERFAGLIFVLANVIVWTLVDLRIKLYDEKQKKVYKNLISARTDIIEKIKDYTERSSKVEIKIIAGKAREISGWLDEIFDAIKNGNLKGAKNTKFIIYCINPIFLRSINMEGLYSSDYSHREHINKIALYDKHIIELNNTITTLNDNSIFRHNYISAELKLYNAFPNVFAFIINDAHIFWGDFSWTNELDFGGSANRCYYSKRQDLTFEDHYNSLQQKLEFLEASGKMKIRMEDDSNPIYDEKQVARINKFAYESLYEDYLSLKEKYRAISTTNNQIIELSKYLKKHFDSKRVTSILEIGPGAGYLTELLSTKNRRLSCIELSSKFVKNLRDNFSHLEIIEDDFLHYNFPDSRKFDCVLAISFIHLYPSKYTLPILARIYQILKKNGILYISTTMHDFSKEGYYTKEEDQFGEVLRYRKEFTKAELEVYIENSGFEVIDSYDRYDDLRPNKKWMAFLLQKK